MTNQFWIETKNEGDRKINAHNTKINSQRSTILSKRQQALKCIQINLNKGTKEQKDMEIEEKTADEIKDS